MERYERRCLLYADFEAARDAVEDAGSNPVAFGEALAGFAGGHGRLLAATLYGDLDTGDVKGLRQAGVEARLTTEEGEGSAPESIGLALDASAALASGPQAEVVVVLTDDAQLAELVRRLRRAGRYVVAVVPEALLEAQPARSADRAVSVEAVVSGDAKAEVPPPPPPARTGAPRPERARAHQPLDLDTYDWTRLVVLLRDLEAKMPFVGMRWLKNKVLGPHNVGVASVNDKQALLNRAVDDGLIETYRVDNREEGGEPVTACRLHREHERVRAILDQHAASEPVSEGSGEQPQRARGGPISP